MPDTDPLFELPKYSHTPNPVSEYCLFYTLSGKTPTEFAQYMLSHKKDLCLRVVEDIGSWPSSEPELRALQEQYR